jgi:hypothetical protein
MTKLIELVKIEHTLNAIAVVSNKITELQEHESKLKKRLASEISEFNLTSCKVKITTK